MARQVADRLLSLAQRWAPATGEGGSGLVDPGDPATWRAVALALGLAVVEESEPGGGRGLYIPAGAEGGPVEWAVPGVVCINTAYGREDQARAWVHELAHHLQLWWPQPPLLLEAGRRYPYEGDRRMVQHDVAARVERLVVGKR